MAPLAVAVGLVDGDEPQIEAGQDPSDGGLDPLRRRVTELVLAGGERPDPPLALLGWERRREVGRANADLGHGVDLVLHERDERRDDQRDAAQHPRGYLIGERLPRPGGHDPHAVTPGEQRVDDLQLTGAKRGIAEDVAEDLERRRPGERTHRQGPPDLAQQRHGRRTERLGASLEGGP